MHETERYSVEHSDPCGKHTQVALESPAMQTILSWTAVIWSLQILLTHTVVSLPSPVNVSILSFNLEHKLTWLPGNGTPTSTHFRVQSSQDSGSWLDVPGCVDLGSGESCDLTSFLDPYNTYALRVQAYTSNTTSNWTNSQLFIPVIDTVLGPPVLQVTGCGSCLKMHISPPACRERCHQNTINYLYRTVDAQVTRSRDKAEFSLRVRLGETVIDYLEPEAEYCVTVAMVTNHITMPSQPHCAYTSPKSVNSVWVLVCVLSALSLMVTLCFCAALLYSGLLLPRRQALPKTLSSVSSLTLSPPWMSTQDPELQQVADQEHTPSLSHTTPHMPSLSLSVTHTPSLTHTHPQDPELQQAAKQEHTHTHTMLHEPVFHLTTDQLEQAPGDTTHTITHTHSQEMDKTKEEYGILS